MPELRSKYMKMELLESTGKTKRWAVESQSSGDVLGYIKWYGPWRQYCFFPNSVTLYNSGCLASLVAFLSDANLEHRKGE